MPFGLYEYVFMPFGLRNAGQSFQRYIDHVLQGLDFVFVYLDDILIFSENEEEHEKHLRLVLERLKSAGLKLNLAKCEFGKKEIVFLSHLINSHGSKPTKEMVQAISEFPKPKTVASLRQFLGLINFYRRGIPHAASEQAPLYEFTHNSRKNDKRPVNWTPEAEQAFEKVKTNLANATMLSHPSPDAETRVVTDASDFAMGAALEQFLEGSWRPLAFFSRKFSKSQLNYSAYDRELTAIYEAIKYFKYFLEGRKFKIATDHKPLVYAFAQRADKASPRQRRQLCFISQFSTQIEHLSGSSNVVADSLSRINAIRLPLEVDLLELSKLQAEDTELEDLRKSKDHSLKLTFIEWGQDHNRVCCDHTGNILRPYIPSPLRKRVFDMFHSLAHGSAKVMDQVIKQKYVWPGMHKDIKNWCLTCLDCQQSKVTRHVKNNPSPFVAPDSRFSHIHMDIVGPLHPSEGFTYLLTIIDRFSRWTEAIPIKDMTAQTVCRAFYDNWISRFGTPRILTTDQGSNFESKLFSALLSLIGCERKRTTAYHPKANGMIERWHRVLKAAIMCHNDANWVRTLSTVLLGLRTHVRPDTGSSPAEYLYGTTLRVPGEFCLDDDFAPNPQIFLEEFREHMRKIRPIPVTHNYKPRAFFYKDLHTCTHVFLRTAAVKKPLERPYTGPHKVLERINDLNFKIEVKGSPRVVTTELLKPAHFLLEVNETSQNPADVPAPPQPANAPNPAPAAPAQNPASNPTPPANVATPLRPALKTYSRKTTKKRVTLNTAAIQIFTY